MQEINEVKAGMRIDKFLSETTTFSRSKIQRMLDDGYIVVRGTVVKANYILKEGDFITIDTSYERPITIQKEEIPLDIYYEDEDILVVNKPSGMVVHPAPGHPCNTLVNAILGHLGKEESNDIRPGIVHRIDKDTSGLLMIAKNDTIHEALSEELKKHKPVRKYIALVHGVIPHETGTIDAPIGRDNKDRKKMAVTDQNSKDAVTHFRVLKRYQEATLIECTLETGRTHQIRVHMNYIGYPIIGDPVYGRKKSIHPFGQLLHASTLGFLHPKTKEYLEFHAPLPEEFETTLKQFEEQ